MSVTEYARRLEMADREKSPETGPAMLLEIATLLVELAISMQTLASLWRKEETS